MSAGNESSVAKTNDTNWSNRPRKYPAKMPIGPPTTNPTKIAMNPTSSEIRDPQMVIENTSRPEYVCPEPQPRARPFELFANSCCARVF